MSNAPKRIADLSPNERRALLGQLLHEKAGEPRSSPPSFAQERLWILEQLEPDTPAYNIPAAVLLRGALDVTALKRSLSEIVRRHEALRTTFVSVKGRAVQHIAPAALELSLPVVNLEVLPEGEQQQEVRRLALEEAQRPFDLERGPLFRAKLLRLDEEEHVLLLTMHHIVSDGWSMRMLFRELGGLYEAFSEGKPSPLAELPIQYADYAAWQRRWLQGEVLERQLSYWKRQLDDVPVLELPTDRPRPPVQTYRGERQELVLPSSLTEALKELSRQEGVTVFMVVLAAFQVLLSRYSGQEDIAIGSPIANRNRTEIEGLIGFFANTLVLRTNLSGDPTFKELLGRVREVALGAYDHQDLPFEKLVEELQPERDLSRTPLFQVMFALQDAPGQALKLPGLTLSWLDIDNATAKFDLTLSMSEKAEGLKGWLEYNTDLFEEATIARMMEHFRTLLEGVVADPERCLSALPLLTEAECHQLLVEWNDTQTDYPREACIHQLFEEQAERTPEAVAVVFDDQQLTYRELNRRANQLAHHLRRLGVGPEVLTGIFVERSVEMVVGLLGILKAGGAYLPLDPAYPAERLAFMLEDAQVPVLLTQERLVEGLPEHETRQLVCLDADYWPAIAREREENLSSGAMADTLAYVVYTSGSTGVPKGVMVEHRAVARLVMNTDYARLTSADVVAQASNATFDAATWEIWGALLHGARLVIVPRDTVLSAHALAAAIEQQQISALFLTTVLFNHMAREKPAAFRPLRHLLFGGEAVEPQWVREVLAEGAPERLLHVYGPTETTTFATWHLVEEVEEGAATIPIGRPIANTEAYILDAHLRPVPIGVTGELYAGGDGLAREYLNRAELTAEKFVPNPFSNEPRARLYRTGDLARYLPDGNIEFVGRIDQQVKVRGFRVELGEIESVLGQHPVVGEAVVVVREDKPDDKRLIAYIVPTAQQQEPTTSELRAYLKEKLPEYMIPSAFVVLEALSLTANGKVDRRALPVPDTSSIRSEDAYAQLRTPVEEALSEIWAEVLGIERVGIHDNFFELGGHSLLVVQVMGRLNEHFGVELPLRALFDTPTVAGLALTITQTKAEAEADIDQMLAQVEQMEDRSIS